MRQNVNWFWYSFSRFECMDARYTGVIKRWSTYHMEWSLMHTIHFQLLDVTMKPIGIHTQSASRTKDFRRCFIFTVDPFQIIHLPVSTVHTYVCLNRAHFSPSFYFIFSLGCVYSFTGGNFQLNSNIKKPKATRSNKKRRNKKKQL